MMEDDNAESSIAKLVPFIFGPIISVVTLHCPYAILDFKERVRIPGALHQCIACQKNWGKEFSQMYSAAYNCKMIMPVENMRYR
jgi:hypothetical protein